MDDLNQFLFWYGHTVLYPFQEHAEHTGILKVGRIVRDGIALIIHRDLCLDTDNIRAEPVTVFAGAEFQQCVIRQKGIQIISDVGTWNTAVFDRDRVIEIGTAADLGYSIMQDIPDQVVHNAVMCIKGGAVEPGFSAKLHHCDGMRRVFVHKGNKRLF